MYQHTSIKSLCFCKPSRLSANSSRIWLQHQNRDNAASQ